MRHHWQLSILNEPSNLKRRNRMRRWGKFIHNLKQVSRQQHCSTLLMHHIRKPDQKLGVPSLVDTPALKLLLQASGARALINQTNTRIALDVPPRRQIESDGHSTDAVMVMK